MEALITEEQLERVRIRFNVTQEWLERNLIYPKLYTEWAPYFPHDRRETIDQLIKQMIEERHYRIG